MKYFEMFYVICNQSNGYASFQPCQSEHDAEAALDGANEPMQDEPEKIKLRYDEETGILSFQDLQYNHDSGRHDWVWIHLHPNREQQPDPDLMLNAEF